MFALYTDTPEFYNDICDEIRLFVPEKHIELVNRGDRDAARLLRHLFWHDEAGWHNRVEYYEDGALRNSMEVKPDFRDENGAVLDVVQPTLAAKKAKKHLIKGQVYELLRACFGEDKPWGSLTGIRPTKLLRELAAASGPDSARRAFRERYFVSERRTDLAQTILKQQKPYLDSSERDIDVYVGIPFCISRCKYCSFVSRDLRYDAKLKDEYLACLSRELEDMRPVLQAYHVRAVYIGGGTPTALLAEELETLLGKIAEVTGPVREFTVEAGRPDTITPEKLECIKRAGANRISINAQTTNDDTLIRIGRKHSKEDFFRAFELAKTYGFQSINTDIILGLPRETVCDVRQTLLDVTSFDPENVTVHTLALKHSSEFALENHELLDARTVEEMVEEAQAFLTGKGYLPYYLYRQKYMSGNMENVGFAKPGLESVYNIDIMEETANIMAFGAGGISKRLYPAANRLERAANVKDIRTYIERIDEMAARKKKLFRDGC